ncbi:DUF5701 family protein [Nonomuraea sp. CA-143628]|uniref:DUF5701 family protein n=1 Tax=Nonomuraea sp. CA-143628 TaxID=3239997 RepID=UPI003D89C765
MTGDNDRRSRGTRPPAWWTSNAARSSAGPYPGTPLWISQNAPELGWCWERNPHTWLGMASAGNRRTADDRLAG